jgi:DNA polymerase I-like protein with 3'-5' exonuclease and polymerase domains
LDNSLTPSGVHGTLAPVNPVVICDAKEANGIMFTKMWRRTGLAAPRIVEPFSKIPDDADFLILVGESLLNQFKGDGDLFRWMGRRTTVEMQGRTLPAMFCQRPSLLVPRFMGDDEPKSQLYRKPSRFQGAWVRWMQRAWSGKWPHSEPVTYIEDPLTSHWDRIVEEYLAAKSPISIDIETAYKIKVTDDEDQEEVELKTGAILRISFSYKPFHAVSVPWTGQYLHGIRKLLAAPETIWWNGANFDVPRLRKEGCCIDGIVYDAMDAWHLLESQEPAGLEYVSTEYTDVAPWKHLNTSKFGWYSCADADIALRNFLGIKKDLEHFGMWQLFLEDSVELMPILDRAGQRGNAIDRDYSVNLKEELIREKTRLNAEVQPLIPTNLLPRDRRLTLPFGSADIDHARSHPELVVLRDSRRFEPVYVEKEGPVCNVCGTLASNRTEHHKGGKKNPCKAGKIEKAPWTFVEWDEILPFNLASHTQIKEVIRSYGHPLGINRKETDKNGKYKESANRKHLEKLFTAHNATHPFYAIKIEEAKVSKTLSTYCAVDLVEDDGLLHTHFTNTPWSWRLASTAINMQTWGKRESNPWAKKARRQVVARDGYVFVEADSTSIEAIITGFSIGDDNFIQVAKESIHAYLCCQELGLPFDTHHIELVKSKYEGLYSQFKTAVYLLLYGGDPYLMFMENPKLFPTIEAAREIQEKIFRILPKLKAFQESIRDRAKKEGTIRGLFGHRASFYDVYTFRKNKKDEIILDELGEPKLKLGTDAKSVLAFTAQNAAGKFGRDSLRMMGNSKWAEFMTAACFVHDGYLLEVPEELKYEAEQFLVDTLTRPVPELGNLRIPCESGFGYNWASADPKFKTFLDGNPRGMTTYRKVMV